MQNLKQGSRVRQGFLIGLPRPTTVMGQGSMNLDRVNVTSNENIAFPSIKNEVTHHSCDNGSCDFVTKRIFSKHVIAVADLVKNHTCLVSLPDDDRIRPATRSRYLVCY